MFLSKRFILHERLASLSNNCVYMSICVRASVGNALGIRVSWLSLTIKEVMLRV